MKRGLLVLISVALLALLWGHWIPRALPATGERHAVYHQHRLVRPAPPTPWARFTLCMMRRAPDADVSLTRDHYRNIIALYPDGHWSETALDVYHGIVYAVVTVYDNYHSYAAHRAVVERCTSEIVGG